MPVMRTKSILLLVLLCLAATAPADKYNLPVQSRTRDCVRMSQAKVPLRFADGKPTGFFVSADDPSQVAEGKKPCPRGSMEIDAHEIITTAGGTKLYFHAGGGMYDDRIENGQYGHVAAEDLKSAPKLKPTGNGAAAPLSPMVYFVEPTRIPDDMFYKPNANAEGRTGSTYYTYGNPGYDKTLGRGDWTYLNWSWVQNGHGDQFPENKCNGGGMVRALARRDDAFFAGDVQPIVGYSYGPDNQVNGRVTAVYGRLDNCNPSQQIFGWMPISYQKSNDIIVPCLRRAPLKGLPKTAPPASKSADRAERMSRNLLNPIKPDVAVAEKMRAEFLRNIVAANDMAARMELITDIARVDDEKTVETLLKVITDDGHPVGAEQAIAVLGFMAATPGDVAQVAPALAAACQKMTDSRLHIRAIDIMSNIPDAQSLEFLKQMESRAGDAEERVAIAYAILKLAPRIPIDQALVTKARDVMRQHAELNKRRTG